MRRSRFALSFLFLGIPLGGCSAGREAYVFSQGLHTARTVWNEFEVVSADGKRAVREWIDNHETPLRKASELYPGMAIELFTFLYHKRADGSSIEYPLLGSYPKDFNEPKGERTAFVENIPARDMEELRRIFMAYGRQCTIRGSSPKMWRE